MLRSQNHSLENLRHKSQGLAQELHDLKSLRDEVRRLEVSVQSERHPSGGAARGRTPRGQFGRPRLRIV
jgi:hypothetical protein